MEETSDKRPRMTQAELIMQMAQLNVEYEKKLEKLEQRQILLEERVKELLKKNEVSGTMSTVAAYVNKNQLPIYVRDLNQIGRQVSQLCKKRGYEPQKVRVERFGEVNSYPDLILYEFFDSYLKYKQETLANEVTAQMRKNQ